MTNLETVCTQNPCKDHYCVIAHHLELLQQLCVSETDVCVEGDIVDIMIYFKYIVCVIVTHVHELSLCEANFEVTSYFSFNNIGISKSNLSL